MKKNTHQWIIGALANNSIRITIIDEYIPRWLWKICGHNLQGPTELEEKYKEVYEFFKTRVNKLKFGFKFSSVNVSIGLTSDDKYCSTKTREQKSCYFPKAKLCFLN